MAVCVCVCGMETQHMKPLQAKQMGVTELDSENNTESSFVTRVIRDKALIEGSLADL